MKPFASAFETQASSSHPVEQWSACKLAECEQFDAWRQAIVDAHLSWDIPDIECERFPAYVRQYRMPNGLRLTDCTTAAPVHGRRGRAQVSRDDNAYLTATLIVAGTERLDYEGGQVAVLPPGTFTLWDSTKPLTFATSEDLRQVSLMLPQELLLQRLPQARELVGRPINGLQGAGGLFTDHLTSLLRRLPEMSEQAQQQAAGVAADLLGLCLREQAPLAQTRWRQVMLEQMRRRIDLRLRDPSLNAAWLAHEFGMTERNVHKLFESTGQTVGAYIRHRRLALCKRDLTSSLLASRPVAEIARHWGFRDMGHFGKLFRSAFGLSPSALRAAGARAPV